jgi:hypothetical protein
VTLEEIRKEGGSLNIPLYIGAPEQVSVTDGATNGNSIGESLAAWLTSASELRCEVKEILGEKHVPPQVPLMTTIGKTLPSWLKRQEWKRLAFGTFADSINERVEPGDAAEETLLRL